MSDLPVLFTDDATYVADENGTALLLVDADLVLLAQRVDELWTMARAVKAAREALDAELDRRLKYLRQKKVDVGHFVVEAKTTRKWDEGKTWAALSALVEGGDISAADADEAMPEKAERKPDGRKLNALLTHIVGEDPEAAAPLALARQSQTSIKVHAYPERRALAEAAEAELS